MVIEIQLKFHSAGGYGGKKLLWFEIELIDHSV